ncbi:MAG TPA: (d)CMP kinase [Thermoanaerobaculaceae bacterium]|nr:(d)CMP kinase [Thermoanaerobaculaceae bacterium]HRS16636.1 (d)CMP kinase [Thermoanaerobaculaceae bacterium]
MKRPIIIAIDGPAGAGKSATAREVALRLGVPYLDTGAMYRVVGLAAMRRCIRPPLRPACEEQLVELAGLLQIGFAGDPREQRVLMDGEDVTAELRTPAASVMASVVSAVPGVRRELVRQQRQLAAATGGVVEGRDIGTVVFPDADVKVFLTASPEVRAQRRLAELTAKGVRTSWEEVLEEQRQRDERDSTRADSPLRPAPGAHILDTSNLTLEQVVARVLSLVP